MAEWLRLKSAPPPFAPDVPGVLLDVVVSPYDIPEAVRALRTPQGRFRIEFRYIDGPEPAGPTVKIDQHVTAEEGRHTGRPLALEVDIDAIGVRAVGVSISTTQQLAQREQIQKRIDEALNAFVEHSASTQRSVYEQARAAVKTREQDVVSQLVGN